MVDFKCITCGKELERKTNGSTTSCPICKTGYHIDCHGSVTTKDKRPIAAKKSR